MAGDPAARTGPRWIGRWPRRKHRSEVKDREQTANEHPQAMANQSDQHEYNCHDEKNLSQQGLLIASHRRFSRLESEMISDGWPSQAFL